MGETEIQLHSVSSSAVDGGKWSDVTLQPLYPRQRTPVPAEVEILVWRAVQNFRVEVAFAKRM